MRNNKGFTLVELAIVLVIIGVILGGVMKGQELVKSAKVKRFYRDYQAVQYAYLTYIEQNAGRLPGDDAKAATTYSGATNGDGDGYVEGGGGTPTGENTYFWADLRYASLYPDSAAKTDIPNSVFGNVIYISYNQHGLTGRHHQVCYSGMSGEYARLADNAFDDGLIATGEIRGGTTGTYSDTATYNLCIAVD